jgi:hypothetical protein
LISPILLCDGSLVLMAICPATWLVWPTTVLGLPKRISSIVKVACDDELSMAKIVVSPLAVSVGRRHGSAASCGGVAGARAEDIDGPDDGADNHKGGGDGERPPTEKRLQHGMYSPTDGWRV